MSNSTMETGPRSKVKMLVVHTKKKKRHRQIYSVPLLPGAIIVVYEYFSSCQCYGDFMREYMR